jgi:hypothetical protein
MVHARPSANHSLRQATRPSAEYNPHRVKYKAAANKNQKVNGPTN